MTTFTDKELIKEIKERISSLDVRDNIERRAYEIALASLEAEPVAYIFKHPDGKLFWALTDESNKEQSDVIPVYAAPPVPVVPEEKPMPNPLKMYAVDAVAAIAEVRGRNACRAAMLQGSQPVSNHEELPLDYLQGQKDGLEWAAQLAEANHPQTGDWLYDDPLELAKAIRKGPDMPEFDGPTPVTPDGWISCSERMPEKGQNVLISVNFDSSLVEPLICSARYTGSTFRRGDATIKPGNAIEQATHWMPLPEPPQEVK
ncbi:DUF551 domain-containing protein [Escherichia coli]|nr:DUF551 domain-containing protein [Escherichia coli]EHO2780510.1 DUF551 domain-containing protein [Escherichia coli]EHV3002737.1 DUF551 domain-containing protein [Escherichia coli]EII8444500.1 DUF551 domain-containing protein [Escherichia coli]EIK7213685.1 DUF551 domain-containing protein [Escherichia coli]